MPVTITTLVENSPSEHLGLQAEHGLSFLIQSGTETIVFDTGQSDRFLSNASQLNLDLPRVVTRVVLSHGHYDHTGGLRALLNQTERNLTIDVGAGFFSPKYALNGPSLVYLGNNFGRDELIARGHTVTEHSADTTEIAPDVYIITAYRRDVDREWPNERFVVPDASGNMVMDRFDDEISIVARSDRGLVVLVGCSHPGILNILATVEDRFSDPIYAVLGGTHLVEASGSRLDRAIESLAARGDTLLGMSHCTGEEAMGRLAEVSPHYFHNHTGVRLIVR
jgi:7,8-dihydropterin-6-yl-methyl-4-(beta-D-ribofuranosyl)aminobenzene 5'-phosphate synthase